MTKRMKIALGVMVFALGLTALSVFLLSGSGNGYESVFKAGVKSITDTESVSVKAGVKGYVNGERLIDLDAKYLINGSDRYEYENDRMQNTQWEAYTVGGVRYNNIDHDNKTYQVYDTNYDSFAMQYSDDDDEREETIARIVKLFLDFYMGNAKNQFVREPVSGANRYTITLKREQLPDLAVLMLKLFNQMESAAGYESDYTKVEYMDFRETLRAEHLLRTGKEMDERVFDLYYENNLLMEAYGSFQDEVREKYRKLGEAQYEHGCVFVEADGSCQVYPSKREMYVQRLSEGKPLTDQMDPLDYPKNADIKFVHGEFDVSDEGYITRVYVTGEGSVQDVMDKTYTCVIEALAEMDKYNETVVDVTPLSEYAAKEEETKTYKTVYKNETIEFLGKKYFVHYSEKVEE